jgi:hypothetical protein
MQSESKRRLFKSRIAVGVLGIMLCTPSLSLGWGAGGHMMVASIAFKRLNPRAKAQAMALLARPVNPVAVSAESKDFVNAAHWADDLRPFEEFDHLKALHFIDQPFSTDGTKLPTDLPGSDTIVQALKDNVNILRTSTDKDAQAQALRLIIHFVGDIHQPLHCATRIDSANPEGDRGGNLVSIMIPGTGGELRKSNLHSYWDGGIGSFPRIGPNFAPPPLSQIPDAAAKAMAGNPPTDRHLKLDHPFDFSAWAKESLALAKDVAYKGMKKDVEPSAKYNAASLKVVRKRVAWGGYRLAALLNAIWP